MNDKLIILKRFAVLFVVVFVLDFGVGALLKKSYFSYKAGYEYKTTKMINSVKTDILIFGSSRAEHHYSCPLIQDSLKLTAYNGGRGGCYMFFYYATFKAATVRYHPKLIVLDILPDEFAFNSEAYDHLSMLLPYYDTHPEIRPICELKGRFEKYKVLSKIYPYNSHFLYAITTALSFLKKSDPYMGYNPMAGTYNLPEPTEKYPAAIDTLKLAYFKRFVNDCKSMHIPLIVAVSPVFKKSTAPIPSIVLARDICTEKKIPFYDYSQKKEFTDGKYFNDLVHMNGTGAELYTNAFIPYMKEALKSGN